MQGAALEQRLQHGVHAARRVQILGEEAPAGLQVRDERRPLSHARKIVQRETNVRLVRDRGDVQRRVGRAAGRSDGRRRVLQALARHQRARQWAAAREELHDRRTGFACNGTALGVDGRQRRRAGQREAERLGHHRHRIGGELAGTGTERRQARALEFGELALRHVPGEDGADAFIGIEHRHFAAAPAARERGAAVNEDRGDVEAHHGHHHPGQRLVAAGKADQRVVGVAAHDRLDAVGDDFARHK